MPTTTKSAKAGEKLDQGCRTDDQKCRWSERQVNNETEDPKVEIAQVVVDIGERRFDIPVQINDDTYTALIDTEASVTCVRAGLIDISIRTTKQMVIGFKTDMVDRSLGYITFKMKIGTLEVEMEALILPNLNEEIILGYPWLKQRNMLMDLVNDCIYLENAPRQSGTTHHRIKRT